MPRFFVETIPPQQETFSITSFDEVHHMAHVLRLRAGDKVELIDGKGVLALAVIQDVSRHEVLVRIESFHSASPRTQGRIILACAIPKKAKFETILEKCTELGVDEIIPILTERTEVRPKAGGTKDERFLKVVINASKQSKRLFFPVLHPVTEFDDVLKQSSLAGRVILIPWLEGERRSLKDVLSLHPAAREFMVLIGPEGDFTPDEVATAMRYGAVPLTLGDNTLKVDTAAMAVVAGIRMLV